MMNRDLISEYKTRIAELEHELDIYKNSTHRINNNALWKYAEELEETNRIKTDAMKAMESCNKRVMRQRDELEGKLKRTVEALRFVDEHACHPDRSEGTCSWSCCSIASGNIARAVLADLEKE
jgi:hypothetical protein